MRKLFKKICRWMGAVYLLSMLATGVSAQNYGLPSGIQQGNILHCFNWPINDIKAELPNIAAAGFGSVQISPVQRPDSKAGSPWHDLYRPYDLAFKGSSYCSEQDLRNLCSEAAKYGIKIIVDVVANHVDKTAGYHDSWWDSNNRVRWNGGINYGDRYSITHGQLGDYGDVNSEHSEVIARGKAYVEKLKSMGVKGIRWDAAKHIALPSEGCGFWSSVTSVPGMWHYGEILDNPGPNASIIKEYGNFMSVTDNEYCNYAARDNGGIPTGYGGSWAVNYGMGAKCVYWAESHDTYSNDEWSMNRDQGTIDRAYAAYACRNNEAALYLSRPNTKGFDNIKVGKGSTAFKSKAIAEVNKFRNMMVGKADYFDSNGNACSITRQGGGAVIVMKGSGNVTVKNGGGYCPSGTYKDQVSGGTFTVNGSTISGNVGSSGIAVIYADGITPPQGGGDTPNTPVASGSFYVLGNIDGAQWTTSNGAAMTAEGSKYVARGVKLTAAVGETTCYFNITDALGADWDELNMVANRYGAATEGAPITLGTPATVVKYANNVDASGCLSWTIAPGSYDISFDPSAMTVTVTNAGSTPVVDPVTPPVVDPETPDNPVLTGSYYVLGNIEGAQWDTTKGAAMTAVGSSFVAKNVKLTAAVGETTCYFNITDALGADWNELNMVANRYGAASEGAPITLGTPATVVKYANNVDASGCLSWTIAPGSYDISFDPSAMTVTVTNAGSTPDVDPVTPPVVEPETPDEPVLTGSYYVLGNIEGAQWTTNAGAAMTADNGSYIAKSVKLVAATGETKCYFNITDKLGADWNELNLTANRYGAKVEGDAITLGVPASVVEYANGIAASGCKSWTLPSGTYDIVFDPTAMTVTVTNSQSTPDIDPVIPPVVDPETPDEPVLSDSYYILGNIEGAQWSTDNGVAMTAEDGVYVAKDVTLSASPGETVCYFNITDALGADWDELNMVANRYGAATEGAPITLGTPATVVKYANNVDASGCLSWTIAPGTYDIVFNPVAMTVTVTDPRVSGVEGIGEDYSAPKYYNLQGVQVNNPSKGIYIVVRGNKVSKEFIR